MGGALDSRGQRSNSRPEKLRGRSFRSLNARLGLMVSGHNVPGQNATVAFETR